MKNGRALQILLVTGIFPPDDGGPATYVPIVAKELQARGYGVRVVTFSDVLKSHHEFPFPVSRIPRSLPYPLRAVLAWATIFRYGLASDVLYVNGLYLPAVLANFFLRRKICAKFVGDPAWERANARGWFTGTIDEFQGAPGWHHRIARFLRSWGAKQFSKVIVPGQYLRALVEGWGVPPERIKVIYNASPTVEPGVRTEKSGISKRILVVSRLVPHKQVEQVIRVFSDLKECSLSIIGEGPCRSSLSALVSSSGISNRVDFLGAVSRPEVLKHLSTADLLVLNSTYEGLPHVVLEATASGVPVVVRSSGGSPEAVIDGETGFLVIDPSDKALSDAIVRALSFGSFPGFSLGQRKLLEKFSYPRMVGETVQNIESIVGFSHGVV